MTSAGALEGLRVLELGGFEAAAYCGKLFADLGAEVIKVEPPGGDPARQRPPLVDVGRGRQEGAHFAWLNTNKRSVVLGADDGEALQSLALASDVLIDGRMGADAARWRAAIAERNPGLTMVALSWFGETGPYRDLAATDATVRALAGVVWPIGAPGEPPAPLHDHQASVVGGLNAFTAALAARFADDPGRRFEVSLLEANLAISEFYASIAIAAGGGERRYGRNRFRPTFPMGIYPCREGWIGVTVTSLDQWRGFCELLGLRAEIADPALGLAINRFERADALEARYAPLFRQKTAAEWFELALEMRLPFAIVPRMPELLAQPAHRERGAFAAVTIGEARFDAPVLPQRLTVPSQPANGDAPLAGADTERLRALPPRPATARTDPSADRRRPLAGVRIVDLTMGWAGPLATRQLGDLGAEILKVESCGYPDWWRGADPREAAVRERQFEKSVIFNALNRNKKGITLDLTKPEGAELLKRLVAASDAVIENYSHGVLPKLGLDYAHLNTVNPALVMVSMPAFGGDTAWRNARAYGSTLEHASGLPAVTGGASDPPTMNHLALGDPMGGLNAAAALLAGLYHRRRTGQGQHVDLSQVQCLFPLVAPWAIEQAVTGGVERYGGRHPRFAPHGCFRCRGDEAWVLIAVRRDEEWRRLCALIGRDDLAHGPAGLASRRAIEDVAEPAISAWTEGRTADEAMRALQEIGVAAGVVRRPGELLGDAQLDARDAWEWVDRPWIGVHPQTLAAFREDGAPYPVIHPSPLLGEFNAEVLGGILGLTPAEIDGLAARGVIGWEVVPSSRTSIRRA